jgi:superfamily II helicase
MDQDVFNLDLRKFLKRFGVTSQREIEQAVTDALENGALKGDETLVVKATLTIPGVLNELRVDGEIGLARPASRE